VGGAEAKADAMTHSTAMTLAATVATAPAVTATTRGTSAACTGAATAATGASAATAPGTPSTATAASVGPYWIRNRQPGHYTDENNKNLFHGEEEAAV